MPKATIAAISYYLPEKVFDNENINSLFPEWTIDKVSEKTGISCRHISQNDEFSSDMAVKAANKLFAENDILPSSIDFVLLCTQSPDYFLPTTACIVQSRLKIPTSAGALDFNLGCSGFIYGLGIAKGLIYGGIASNILLLTSETYSKFIHPNDKSNRTIFGDAAAATLINSKGYAEILDFELGTDGRGAENLIVKNGGMRFPVYSDNDQNEPNGNNLFMNGAEIFNFTSIAVPSLVNNTLLKNNLEISDIQLFIFHQANKFILNHLRKKIGIEESKFFYYLNDCGNTVSSTIPIALFEAVKSKQAFGNVVLAGFGVGYSWGATVLKIN
jgi:3-oxoacyl-[acyl-carrier-protein] synthase-3